MRGRRSGAGWLGRLRRVQGLRGRLAWLMAGYIRLVARTTRWQIEGAEHHRAVLAGQHGVIAAVWHGRLFLSPTWAEPGRTSIAVISNNRDGALIAAIVARFGIEAVRGSTADRRKGRDKGGAVAFQDARAALNEQRALVCITPDGPRGPRMRAQPGVAALAMATGCPVIPVGFSCRWAVCLGSWDRFLLPLPFGRGALVWGAPLSPPTEGALSPYRATIEAAITTATERADRLCARTPTPPGPALEA
ncbi:MAG: lysophospholipid acyltransferase family protein [Pseudomonadota bacterium]